MSQRLLRVRELLKREIGSLLSNDYSFNALVTVNDVDVTPDLKNAHIFIGIIGVVLGINWLIKNDKYYE